MYVYVCQLSFKACVSFKVYIKTRDSPDCHKAIPFEPSKSYILAVMEKKKFNYIDWFGWFCYIGCNGIMLLVLLALMPVLAALAALFFFAWISSIGYFV